MVVATISHVLAFAAGWFTLNAIQDAVEKINDWRDSASWAVTAIAVLIGLNLLNSIFESL